MLVAHKHMQVHMCERRSAVVTETRALKTGFTKRRRAKKKKHVMSIQKPFNSKVYSDERVNVRQVYTAYTPHVCLVQYFD